MSSSSSSVSRKSGTLTLTHCVVARKNGDGFAAGSDPHTKENLSAKLYSALRMLRTDLLKEAGKGVMPYHIFSNDTLQQISKGIPRNKESLLWINGISEATIRKYGDRVLETIEATIKEYYMTDKNSSSGNDSADSVKRRRYTVTVSGADSKDGGDFIESTGPSKIRVLEKQNKSVEGCDGSVLLDPVEGTESERDSINNQSLDGFAVVDDIKNALENVCPGVVSCADILAIASQIGVSRAGLSPPWEVQLGRRDSRTTNKDRADNEIPSPFDNFTVLRRKFTDKGLDSTDLVALSGAHTIGRARCATFQQRLDASNPSPSLDSTYLETLRQQCSGGTTTLVNLDPTTPDGFDNNYFTNLQTNRGLLETDQMLFSTTGADTIASVDRFAGSQTEFFNSFGQSMITLANLGVLTGNSGEIRSDCKRVN